MSKTLRERLLAGEHHGCATWTDVAAKLGVDERHMRVVRKTLAAQGQPVSLTEKPTAIFCVAESFADVSAREHQLVTARLARGTSEIPKAGIDIPNSVTRWPSLAAFEAATFRDEDAVHPPAHEPAPTPHTKRLAREDAPDGTLILWASDIHIPIHNEAACRLMVECAERAGVTRVVAGGDILDMNCLSKHAKESRRTVEHATILEEVEPGRWLLDWFATRQTDYILGNHEDRLKRFVDENPALHGSVVSNFGEVTNLPAGINVLPQGGEVRLGNLVMAHGDAEFKNGTGGAHPASRLLAMAPDQSSICGHLHRMSTACRTSRDEDGIPRTRRAWTMGHLSIEEMHYGYVSKNPNWQTGFGLIRVYWEDDRPRWTVYPIEVLFDRRNRPYFEFEGHVYR